MHYRTSPPAGTLDRFDILDTKEDFEEDSEEVNGER